MTIKTLDIGTNPNDGTGDSLRAASQKINDNFTDPANAASRLVGTAVGNVMGVGAFGIGGDAIELTEDMDEIAKGGLYTVLDTCVGNDSGENGRFIHLPGITPDYAVQLFVGVNGYLGIRQRKGEVSEPLVEFWSRGNTTVDGSGFIKEASPIIKLYSNKIDLNDYKEIEDCIFERVDTGHYIIKGAPLLSRDGWYIETLKDRNNNIYFTLDYEELEDGLHVKTYEPDYSTGRATNGAPVDINEGRFVTLRFEENPSLYPTPEEPEA